MKSYKVVYNAAVSGGLHLSEEAMQWLRDQGLKLKIDYSPSLGGCGPYVTNIPRHNRLLVECIETLGEAANGPAMGITPVAEFHVQTLAGRYYYIDDHDGAGEEVIDISKMIDASETSS